MDTDGTSTERRMGGTQASLLVGVSRVGVALDELVIADAQAEVLRLDLRDGLGDPLLGLDEEVVRVAGQQFVIRELTQQIVVHVVLVGEAAVLQLLLSGGLAETAFVLLEFVEVAHLRPDLERGRGLGQLLRLGLDLGRGGPKCVRLVHLFRDLSHQLLLAEELALGQGLLLGVPALLADRLRQGARRRFLLAGRSHLDLERHGHAHDLRRSRLGLVEAVERGGRQAVTDVDGLFGL